MLLRVYASAPWSRWSQFLDGHREIENLGSLRLKQLIGQLYHNMSYLGLGPFRQFQSIRES